MSTQGQGHNLKSQGEHVLSFLLHIASTSGRIVMNSLPNDKSLDWWKFKEFADDNISVTEKLKFVLGRVENIVGKGENAGSQHFLLFPQCFQKVFFFFFKVVKSRDCMVKG